MFVQLSSTPACDLQPEADRKLPGQDTWRAPKEAAPGKAYGDGPESVGLLDAVTGDGPNNRAFTLVGPEGSPQGVGPGSGQHGAAGSSPTTLFNRFGSGRGSGDTGPGQDRPSSGRLSHSKSAAWALQRSGSLVGSAVTSMRRSLTGVGGSR